MCDKVWNADSTVTSDISWKPDPTSTFIMRADSSLVSEKVSKTDSISLCDKDRKIDTTLSPPLVLSSSSGRPAVVSERKV